jgi:hypothetical protein
MLIGSFLIAESDEKFIIGGSRVTNPGDGYVPSEPVYEAYLWL